MNYICLIDCNNFFASCETIFHPNLKNKPLVVVSGRNGIVIARSKKAKQLGIPMGAASFQYKSLFIKEDVIVRNTNFPLYTDISNRIRETVETFGLKTFVYSIDEMFLLIPRDIAEDSLLSDIQKKIKKWVGIDVSIGMSFTKTLSKIATFYAKRSVNNRKILLEKDEIQGVLHTFKIEDIWGIGRQSAKKLAYFNIFTAEEFLYQNEHFIKKHLSIQGVRIFNELKGINTLSFEEKNPEKSLQITQTFFSDIVSIETIDEVISSFIVKGCAKLRKMKKESSSIVIFLESSRFKSTQNKFIKQVILNEPSNYTPDFLQVKTTALAELISGDIIVKRAGIRFSTLTPSSLTQKNLFMKYNPKKKVLMDSIDKINHQYGSCSVTFCSEKHNLNQKKCSLRCTTHWNELLTISI